MIIDRFYSGYLPITHIYRGTELIWWAAEDHELGRLGQQIHTVINAVMDQAELEALAMECGASVQMSVTMRQGGTLIVVHGGALLLVEATAHQSPAAAIEPETHAQVAADLTARASVARSAAGTVTAEVETGAALHAQPVRPQRGTLTARAEPDAMLRASPSHPRSPELHAEVAPTATMRASSANPMEQQIPVQARTDAQMAASPVRRMTVESNAHVQCSVTAVNAHIELIVVGGAEMALTTGAELRVGEALALSLLSRAAAEIQATMVQSPAVDVATESRVSLATAAPARQGLACPHMASTQASVDVAATARMRPPAITAGRTAPTVATDTTMSESAITATAARQTVTAAMTAAMADDAAKAPVTGTGALTRPAVTLSTWAGPVQRGNNLLIRQAIHVRQEGSTLYIK